MAGFYQKSDESIRFQSANSGNANLQPPNNNSVNNTNLSPPTTEANPSGGNDSNLITGTWETKGYYGDIIRINISMTEEWVAIELLY